MKRILFVSVLFFVFPALSFSQPPSSESSELVMSMTQRSLVMPGYLSDLKALIAKQAYDFWKGGKTERYVSHLNVYAALHEANKYLREDSTSINIYNQVGLLDNRVTAIKFGANPDYYYTSSADGTILRWSIKDRNMLPELIHKSENIIRSIDISEDGSLLIASFYQTGLVLIALSDNESSYDFKEIFDPEPIQTAIFIPGEKNYLSVTKSGDLKIKGISMDTKIVGSTKKKINELAVDQNDGTIYAASDSGTLEAWEKPYEVQEDIEGVIKEIENKSYFGYKLGSYAINCMDLSPNGRQLAIGRERGDVILWNIENKLIDRVISSHQSAITDIDYSPDGKLLLTASRDKSARIWELGESRKLPIILSDHEDWVYSASFDPSGKTIITGSGDRYIRTWPLRASELADRICSQISRNLTVEEWKEFIGKDVDYKKTCPNLD